jgi:hypothetical protein
MLPAFLVVVGDKLRGFLQVRCKFLAAGLIQEVTGPVEEGRGFNLSVFALTTMVSRLFFNIGNILVPTVGPI